jgi:gluconate 2-dehydrogenase gamma chain
MMRMRRPGLPLPSSLLSVTDAADIEALTSQIIPTDDTPGAREAGVTFFIDNVLGSILSHWRPSFESGLREFQQACRAHNPDAASFAALAPARQVEFLRTVDTTRFFEGAAAHFWECCHASTAAIAMAPAGK